MPITDYCDQARLPIAERLKLFVSVCQAVQHAHQKGIIHRDLKPSNILVCLYDGQPVPKVIDFGLAKAMHQSLTERTLYTAHGLMVGTPLYMSPEQAEFNNLDVDTRTDVYSLGVLLYELLTGSTPLEQRQFKDAAFAEILRLIKEEEPTRPSLKLSGSASLPAIASQRGVEPAQLSRAVKGDLDWIVMKSLEKERSRRYETANGMARDVERYLNDEAVEACPPSLRYRMGKVLRRNRGPAIATAIVFLALTAGIIGTTLGLVQANAARQSAVAAEKHALLQARKAKQAAAAELSERNRADAEAAAARAVRDFLQDDLLRQASLQHQVEVNSVFQDGSKFLRNPTINELLDRAAAQLTPDKIEAKFPNLPYVQAEVLKAVGDAYAGASPAKAIEPLQRAIELYQHARGPDDRQTLAARHSLGVALFANRQDAEAEKQLAAICADRTRVLGPQHADTFATRDFLGRTYLSKKEVRAVAFFEQLQADLAKHGGDNHIETLKARFHRGVALTQAGRFDEGIREIEAVKAAGERQGMRSDHPYLITGAYEGGLAYKAKGDHAKAIEQFEKCLKMAQEQNLGPKALWLFQHELGWCYLAASRRNDAIQAFEANLAIAGPTGAQDVVTMEALGWAVRQVDLDRCIGLYELARKLRVARNGPDDLEALRVGHKQASLMREFGKPSEALALWEEFLPRLEKVHGPEHLMVFKGQIEKGRCLAAHMQFEAADALFRDTIARMERHGGIEKTEILEGRHQWMLAVQGRNDHLRTAEMARELASQWRGVDPSQPLRLASTLLVQGSSFVKAGRPDDGEPALREAVAIYAKTSPQSWTIANARQWHGAALQEQGKLAEAEPLLVTAFTEMTERLDQMPRWGKNHRKEIVQRLIALYTAQNKPDEAAKWQQQLDALQGEPTAKTANAKE